MEFLVTGVDKETGEESQETISADNHDEAQLLANARGIMVSSVELKSVWQAIYLLPRSLQVSAVIIIFLLMFHSYFVGREHVKYDIRNAIADGMQELPYAFSGNDKPEEPPAPVTLEMPKPI